MAEMNATSEEQIARVTVSADSGLLEPVIEFVGRMTHRLGLVDTGQIEGAVELVCLNVIEHAFGPDEEGSLDVYVLRGAGQVVVAVEDQGLPFDYSRLQEGEDGTVLETLHRSFDEVRFVNLGSTRQQGRATKAPSPRRRQGASARRRTPQDRGGCRRIRGRSAGDPDDASRGILRALALRLPLLRLQLRLGLHLLSGQDQGAAGEGS